MVLSRFFYLLLLLTVVVGCSDDTLPFPTGGTDETDNFKGDARVFQLGIETSGLNSADVTCKILTPDGQVISRRSSHSRSDGVSIFTLGNGLKDGSYRILYVEYPIEDNPELAHLAERYATAQYGIGCRIDVSEGNIVVCDEFDDDIDLFGSGTKEDPYIISSYAHLIKLMKYVNSDETNKRITSETVFQQTNPINLEQASVECDLRYGWYPIGADNNTPFRGVYLGDELSGLWINRPSSPGVGLFGFVYNASFDGVRISNADVTGNFAVGSLVGATISAGDVRGTTTFTNCSVSNSKITGSDQSFAVGGLVGAIDMHAAALVQKCSSSGGSVSGSYNVGGLVGGAGVYSFLSVGECSNTTPVTGDYSGAGGIIGVADTLVAIGCTNDATVKGGVRYVSGDSNNSGLGVGGICGGTGVSWLTSCVNNGSVSGYNGVGGILGSTRIKGNDNTSTVFNNSYIRWSQNAGSISGNMFVGGICGEAQFGCYGVLNSGTVTGGDYTAGVVGNTSIVVAHNAVNTGSITGGSYTSGIVGKTTWGSIAFDHNYGNVTGSGSHTAGILGLGGNNTIIHYCGNMASIVGSSSGVAGGIVAEVGDPREWTIMNITECVVGSLEIVMAFAGPCIATVAEAIEEGYETVAVLLEATETAVDMALTDFVDVSLTTFGVMELIYPEEMEELSVSLTGVAKDVSGVIAADMDKARRSALVSVMDYGSEQLMSVYNDNLRSNLDFYEVEGNDEIINENINKRREERMEHLEEVSRSNEIQHEILAGITIATSSVLIIAGAAATGGAAIPVMMATSFSAIVGGVNAITKSVNDFAENAVVISQCVNAAVVSGGEAAGIVGVLQDGSLVEGCLNTGELKDPFCSKAKRGSEINYCLSVCHAGVQSFVGFAYLDKNYTNTGFYDYKNEIASGTEKWGVFRDRGVLFLNADDLNNPSRYDQQTYYRPPGLQPDDPTVYYLHFILPVGKDEIWNLASLPDGKTFAIPNISEMRRIE